MLLLHFWPASETVLASRVNLWLALLLRTVQRLVLVHQMGRAWGVGKKWVLFLGLHVHQILAIGSYPQRDIFVLFLYVVVSKIFQKKFLYMLLYIMELTLQSSKAFDKNLKTYPCLNYLRRGLLSMIMPKALKHSIHNDMPY